MPLIRLQSTVMLTIAVIVSTLTGCTQLGLIPLLHRDRPLKATAENPVVEIMCLWEPGEGSGLDNLPSRGFAGQVLLFARGNSSPVIGDGDVTVYVFDDQGTDTEQAKPIHQFEFKQGTWSQYLSETNIGSAYQIFLPYTKRGAHHAECAIRVKYTPAAGGPSVYSRMATIVLPGRKPSQEQNGSGERSAIEPPGRQLPGAIQPAARLDTLTLDGTRKDFPTSGLDRLANAARNLADEMPQAERTPPSSPNSANFGLNEAAIQALREQVGDNQPSTKGRYNLSR